MSQELLKRYLVERLQDLDPSLSVDEGSPVYHKVINPLLARLGADPISVDIEQFVLSRLRDDPLTKGLDIDSAGSFVKDIIARPLMVLLEPLQREIEFIKTQQSRSSADSLAKEELDSLLSNMMSTREYGDVATGNVRVYYSSPQPVSVDASIVFSTSAGLQFVPSSPQVFTESDFVRDGDLSYILLEIQSVVAHIGANIVEGAIKLVSGLPNVVRVTNTARLSGGRTEETNEEFDRRSERNLSERSLNTVRGISTTLNNHFDDIVSVDVVGYREPEMNRDLLTGTVTVSASASPGKVLATLTNFTGYPMVGATADSDAQISTWGATEAFPFTTVIQSSAYASYALFLVAWYKLVGAEFFRAFSSTGSYSDPLLSRTRSIVSIKAIDAADAELTDETDTTARKIRVVLADFSVQASGSADLTSNPYDGAYSDQGADFNLMNNTSDWRGAPLPFTDIVSVPAGLSAYTVSTGRDFLVVRGLTTDATPANYLQAYQVRKKLNNTTLQVSRLDAQQVSRVKVTLPHTVGSDPTVSAASEFIETISYGAPALGDPTTDFAIMFDGINTVTNGAQYHGGCAMYEHDPGTDRTFLRLAPHASRPDGWLSLGVAVGNFISVAAFGGFSGTPSSAVLFDWWQWARISEVGSAVAGGDKHFITVHGLFPNKIRPATALLDYQASLDPFGGDPNYFGFPDASPYRLHWTVYRGELEVALSNGNIHTSYDDFAWVPAYDTSGTGANKWNEDPKYVPSHLHRKLTAGATADYDSFMYRWATSVNAGIAPVANRANWAVVRLDKKFAESVVDGGDLVLQEEPSALHTKLHADLHVLGKYPGVTDVDAWFDSVLTPIISPFHAKAFLWDNVGVNALIAHPLSASFVEPAAPNEMGLTGFSIPTFLGSTGIDIFQFYGASSVTTLDPVISVSDIMGGYPFLDEFGPPVTVSSGSVHLGGATDIYVKGNLTQTSAASISLSPDVIAVSDSGDVVFVGTDGVVDSTYDGLELSSVIFFGAYAAADTAVMLGNVLEVVDSTYAPLVGTTHRILEIDHTAGTIRVGSTLFPGPGSLINIEFRILRSVTTDLVSPKHVYQEGTDLRLTLEGNAVYSDAGFTFPSSIVGVASLEILSGESKGEYPILTYAANKLTVTGPVYGPESGLVFRVYTKGTGVDLPLVRLTNVAMSSDDGVGVEIPYRNPVQVLAESFSGLNNDPEEYSGTLNIRPAGTYATPAHAVGTWTTAHAYHTSASYVFSDNGIIKYDVIKMNNLPAADTFWYVNSIEGSGKVLVLDRDIAATVSAVSGSLGKPSLGDVRVYFMSPTYLSVGPNTIMTTVGGALSFRPSPAESAEIYQSVSTSTDIMISPAGPSVTAMLSSKLIDFAKLGVVVGDLVEITTGCLESDRITAAAAADMSALISKTLIIEIDAVQYSVVLQAVAGGLTLDNISSQINKKLGGLLRAVVEPFNPRVASISQDATTPIVTTILDHGMTTGDSVSISGTSTLPDSCNVTTTATVTAAKTFTINPLDTNTVGFTGLGWLATPSRVLKLYSKSTLVVKDSSSGVLTALALAVGDTNAYGGFTAVVSSIDYEPSSGVWSMVVAESGGVGDIPDAAVDPLFSPELFIAVTRRSYQVTYPADMVKDSNGLYYATVTTSSRAPLTTERIPENTLLVPEGHVTFGYELTVDNTNYSFSAAEQLDISVTPLILPPEAVSLESAIPVVTANIEVAYDRSQLVEDVQSYILSDTGRVVNNNPLARHYLPAYLYLNLEVASRRSKDAIRDDVISYVGGLYPNKELEVFDIDTVLSRGGATSVKHPIEILYLVHGIDRRITPVRSNTAVTLGKVTHIMEDSDNITVEKI